MESLVALGLASNIVQFVDFASKLIVSTRTLYKSTHQTSSNNLILRKVADDLTRLSDAIIVPNHPGDDSLRQLALNAKEVARDLLAVLDDLQIKGKKTTWKSFLLALKEVRHNDIVVSITSSITTLQTQMMLQAQFQIKESITSLSNNIQNLQTTNDRLRLNNTSEIKKLRADLLDAFNTIGTSSRKRRNDDIEHCDEDPILDSKRLAVGDFNTMSRRLPKYQNKISALSRDVSSITVVQDITESFYFDSFTAREAKIPPTHAKTFEWVFRDVLPDGSSKVGFKDWLRSGNGIFWIRGKAGSGKSTLMKFISRHPTTLHHLECWSGSLQLVMGSFYFWNSGTDLQKSQEGLLQSLIFEILRQCPELAPHVQRTLLCNKQNSTSTSRSGKRDSYSSLGGTQTTLARIRNEGWTFCQLTEILKGLLGHSHSRKFCFIIDGLDEYKSQHTQNQQALIDNLCKLAASPNIKLCVSSRPFTVFIDAFDGGTSQCLKLEDLTKDDIRSYTFDKLSGHNQFQKLTQIDPNYSNLVDEVVTKSQGVFLWVFLVVRELFDGLTFNDTIGMMRQRLESFPATLENFFQHMLDSVDKIYLSQTIQLFQLSASAPEPLPMLYYSFLEDIEQDSGLTRNAERLIDQLEVSQRRDVMRRKLDACSRGLLEVVEDQNHPVYIDSSMTVDFLHRSVRDFVISVALNGFQEQSDYERQSGWLLLCKSIILCYRRCSLYYYEKRYRYEAVHTNDKIAYFVKKAQDDGVDLHTIHKTILDAWGVTHASEINSRAAAGFVRSACTHGLIDYISLELLADEESVCNAVACAEELFLFKPGDHEMICYLISIVEMKGFSSKILLRPLLEEMEVQFGVELLHRGNSDDDDMIDIIKTVISTGYKLKRENVRAYYRKHESRTFESKSMTSSTQIYVWFKRQTKALYIGSWLKARRKARRLSEIYQATS
ncbi:hypothetical protein F4680DRAFT_133863 [Xylaria scruposa]|nr:hypothetical protein F4680DRAFT_133863 [Xylaria scruposa]